MTKLAYKDEENDFDDDQDQDAYNQQPDQDDESNGPNRNGQLWSCSCRRYWADWGERCSVNSLHDYVLMLCPQVHLLTETFAITITILIKW